MKTGKAGIELIKKFEGLRLKAYICPAGILTIGYGSTGSHVSKGLEVTKEEAEKLLIKDLDRFEKAINSLVKVPITQNQFDALVSFTFNLGINALRSSTLLKVLNEGKYNLVSSELMKWVHANGKVLNGLVSRRYAEATLFNTK